MPFPDDQFDTLATTQGYLSNGVSQATTILGGPGEDRFVVFHNTAALNLDGGPGDDFFSIRAFALLGSTAIDPNQKATTVKGGDGNDFVEYAVNAPVAIDGGPGVNTVVVIGTEFSDTFVITPTGVFGAGLFVSYVNVQILEVDGLQGDDHFLVQGTSPFVATALYGGLGSDRFDIGGQPVNQPIAVSADSLQGHSGLILNSIETSDPAYKNAVVDSISANVADADEAAVIVTPIGQQRILRGSTGAALDPSDVANPNDAGIKFASYTVVLSQAPAGGKSVKITVTPDELSKSDRGRRQDGPDDLRPNPRGREAVPAQPRASSSPLPTGSRPSSSSSSPRSRSTRTASPSPTGLRTRSPRPSPTPAARPAPSRSPARPTPSNRSRSTASPSAPGNTACPA